MKNQSFMSKLLLLLLVVSVVNVLTGCLPILNFCVLAASCSMRKLAKWKKGNSKTKKYQQS